jgi:hypothetical protein
MGIYSFRLLILIVDAIKESLIEEFKVKDVELLIEHIEEVIVEWHKLIYFRINYLMDLLSINNLFY